MYKVYNFNIDPRNVFVVGDGHGEWSLLKYKIRESGIRDGVIIMAGDCGFGFEKEEFYKLEYNKVKRLLKERNITIVFVRGNHDCIDTQTLTFTKRGWVKYNDLTINDEVLGINIETNKSEWQHINDIIIKNSDHLNILDNQNLSIATTDNHRNLYFDNGSYKYKLTKDIISKEIHIPVTSFINNQEYNISDNEIRLVGWLLTDGTKENDKYYTLYQSKEENIEIIIGLLNELNVNYHENIRTRENVTIFGKKVKKIKPSSTFRLKSEFSKYINEHLLDNTKTLPKWIYELSVRQLNIFVDTLILADGSKYPNKECYILYGEFDILDQFQPIFNMCGYSCNLTQDNRGHYRLNICRKQTVTIKYSKKERLYKRTDGNHTVYCLNVPLSNFLVKRNGKSYFTGNCPEYFDGEKINFEYWKAVPDYSVLSFSPNGEKNGEIPIETHNVLCVGGAISIDRRYRIDSDYQRWMYHKSDKKSYWHNEIPIYKPEILDKIKEDGIQIKTVVTHSSPSFAPLTDKNGIESFIRYDKALIEDISNERLVMTQVYDHLIKKNNHPLKLIVHGHFHQHSLFYSDEDIKIIMLDCINTRNNSWDIYPIER